MRNCPSGDIMGVAIAHVNAAFASLPAHIKVAVTRLILVTPVLYQIKITIKFLCSLPWLTMPILEIKLN